MASRGRPPKYDWDNLTDGDIHTLYEGVDFSCSKPSFRALVYHTANARGLDVSIRMPRNATYVQFRFSGKE